MRNKLVLKLVIGGVAPLLAVTTLAAVSAASSAPPARPQAASRIPHGVTLRQVDGGRHFFTHLHAKSAWMDRTMLIGAWEEEPLNGRQVGYDRKMGNNIYWSVASNPKQRACGGPCLIDYNVMRAHRMHLCTPNGPDARSGSETVCAVAGDELDMTTGPNPSAARQAYEHAPYRRVIVYQGYGKGVLFWETDAQARHFLRYSDILAADSYWMTDSDLSAFSQGGCALLPRRPACLADRGLTEAQRKLPANYAYNVTELERLQALNGASKPVVVDVETGCPGSSGACVRPTEFRAAAWHAIIAGARGIIWFQHNFSGPCVDFNTFHDGSSRGRPMYRCQITPGETLGDLVTAVSAVNHAIIRLNTVLLSPFAERYVSVGAQDVAVMAKYSAGHFYIFAASGRPGRVPLRNQTVTFRLAGGYTGPVAVIGAKRILHAVNGVFTDRFASKNTVHIYKVDN